MKLTSDFDVVIDEEKGIFAGGFTNLKVVFSSLSKHITRGAKKKILQQYRAALLGGKNTDTLTYPFSASKSVNQKIISLKMI